MMDVGELVPDADPADADPHGTPGGAQPATDPPLAAGPLPADEPPAHARRDFRRKRKPAAAGTPKITAGVRGDIHAKISFALDVPGRVWQARDPVCGSVFIQQRDDIAGSLTDIVCQSADLVKFFTGPGGAFMKYLELTAACWPVITVIMAHHVYHSIEDAGGADAPAADYGQYAA
jgi:hypothetical protein